MQGYNPIPSAKSGRSTAPRKKPLGDGPQLGKKEDKMKREYRFQNDLDPTEMQDDFDALYVCASALLAGALHGALEHLPAASNLASACAAIMAQIESADRIGPWLGLAKRILTLTE